jgi:hypothetical protein
MFRLRALERRKTLHILASFVHAVGVPMKKGPLSLNGERGKFRRVDARGVLLSFEPLPG